MDLEIDIPFLAKRSTKDSGVCGAKEQKSPSLEILRFITCGSVDDGKSTLIGRLLHDSQNIYEDHALSLVADSCSYGTQHGRPDYALLLDGLQSEREQGITIDVAYRSFSTDRRRYIVIDTPGHEQYTRNMATGASQADVAVILVDARKGVLTQTLRHSRIVAKMNCRHIVLAVNKMDLIEFNGDEFNRIVTNFLRMTESLGFEQIYPIPTCCLDGDNIIKQSSRTPWYQGKPLLTYLDGITINHDRDAKPFRMPVQLVSRPHLDFRGYAGTIASGTISTGQPIKVLPSGSLTHIKRIIRGFKDVTTAQAGNAVTLTFADDVDVSRGCVLTSIKELPQVANEFCANLIWMHQEPMVIGRPYILKLATKETGAAVTKIDSIEDIGSTLTSKGQHAKSLVMNDIARVNIKTNTPLVIESYKESQTLGGFILIDKMTFATVGVGMIEEIHNQPKGTNLHWETLAIDQKARANAKQQTPCCIWLTGLSGSGKSTLANLLEKHLFSEGRHTYLLDGDNIRHGLNGDLGFSDTDRKENVRRIGATAKLMVDAGLIVLVSLIAPFRRDRQIARELFANGEFIEIYLKTPLAICEMRDPKALYAKARRGDLKNFTGIDSPYEIPENPEITIDTSDRSPLDCINDILRVLKSLGTLDHR